MSSLLYPGSAPLLDACGKVSLRGSQGVIGFMLVQRSFAPVSVAVIGGRKAFEGREDDLLGNI